MIPRVVSVGPLAASAANNIALSQSPGAGAIVLNGSLVTGGVATLDKPRRVSITSAALASPAAPTLGQTPGGALAATTYFVKVTYVDNKGGETLVSAESNFAVLINNLLVVTSPAATPGAVSYNVYASTTTNTETKQAGPIAIGTNWTEPTSGLVAGAAVPGANTTGNDTTTNFTITGTNWTGNTISETLAGGNQASVQSVLDYATVTSVTHSGSVAGTLTIGTTGVASSGWVRLDNFSLPQVALQIDVTGTVNWTVEQSLDDPNSGPAGPPAVLPYQMTWLSHPDTNLVGQTVARQGNYAYAPLWARLTLNSGTGSASMTVSQAGVLVT